MIRTLLTILLMLLPTSCSEFRQLLSLTPPPSTIYEHPVRSIPLFGIIDQAKAEISGLSWYGDYLILLPQYPDFIYGEKSGTQGVIFALPKQQIVDYLDGKQTEPLEPLNIPFLAAGIDQLIPGFEGFEAIAFEGDRFYVTVEAEQGATINGYLLSGMVAENLSSLVVDTSKTIQIPTQTGMRNKSDESIIINGDALLTIYEVNGADFNAAPLLHRFTGDLQPLNPLPFPQINYRITDATASDDTGRFWVVNYFFPGDEELWVAEDPISQQTGLGITHQRYNQVERLLEFQYDGTTIRLTDAAPIQLALSPVAHNWEGVARLDERGFLLVTDTFPGTQLGFVEREGQK